MEKEKQKNGLLFNLLLLTIFFNIWFPKAGIKIGGIPLTIGIVLFVFLTFFWFGQKFKQKFKINTILIFVLGEMIYFILRMLIAVLNGVEFISMIGYIIPLIVFPIISFIVYDDIDSEEKYSKIMKIMIYGFFFLCMYSFLQSIFGIANIDIPGLTVNYTDYKTMGENWFLHKSNGTDLENVKVVSTYQNGNIFGINLLIFFPLIYDYLAEKNKGRLMYIALAFFIITEVLTLSRTCWIGLVLFIIFRIVFSGNKNTGDIIKKMFLLISAIVALYLVFKYVPSVSERILNTDFDSFMQGSGRTEGAMVFLRSAFNEGSFMSNFLIGPFGFIEEKGLAYEMTQLAIFRLGGIIGLVLWCMQFVVFYMATSKRNVVSNSYRISVLVWFIVALIEGAYWLPPTALNLYIMISLGMAYKNIKIIDENKILEEEESI